MNGHFFCQKPSTKNLFKKTLTFFLFGNVLLSTFKYRVMKIEKFLLAALTACTIMSCSKDDSPLPPNQTPPPGGTTPPTETPANKAPEAFDLVEIANGSDGIDLKPTFSWNAAIDPEAAAVTYDLYLDEQEVPTTLVAANLTEPNFTATDSLHLVTDYYWKVIAKDAKGASVSSAINSFITRTLNFPDDPVADNVGFSASSGHSMVSFKKGLFITGGSEGSSKKNDVWTSSNGENWSKVSPDHPSRTQFSPRDFHTTVVFDNKLWVIGGRGTGESKNDVWSSTDGISWSEETPNAQFSKRYGHTMVIFQNKLWVIGGKDESVYMNDVWSSRDGITWKQETMAAGFSTRVNFGIVVFQDKLWGIGGISSGGIVKSDIWSSSDGVNWTEAASDEQFPSITDPSPVVFDDKIILFGVNDSKDIWYSKDGKKWMFMSSPSSNDHSEEQVIYSKATVFKNKIWIHDSRSNEIWALD